MKKTFLLRAGLTVVALPVFILFQAPSSAAINETYGEGVTQSKVSCNENSDAFPDGVFVRLTQGLDRSFSGFEIHLSFADGLCSELLYSSNSMESKMERKRYFENNDVIVAHN